MRTELTNHLCRRDFAELLSLSYRSLKCNHQDQLKALVIDLNRLFYFENAVCAQGNVLGLVQTSQELDIDVCDVSYPDGYLAAYFENRCYLTDAVLCEFLTNLSPVNWQTVDKRCEFNDPASIMASEFNMHDGWAHGTLDRESMACTAFFFGGPFAENNERTSIILEYIVPFYSEAYRRVMKKAIKPLYHFTEREIEVLNWIKEGKSSWEISMILKCSKRVVDFHVANIKRKLNVASRAQAVAICLQHGIIGF
jgi:LuxR family transcriptional regulator, quorum-sensing system regulator CviR